jgi:hypothetical protein
MTTTESTTHTVLCHRVPLQQLPRIPRLRRVGQAPAVRDGVVVVVVVPGRRRRVLRCGRHGAVVVLTTADAAVPAVIVIPLVLHLIEDSAAGDVEAAALSLLLVQPPLQLIQL